MLCKNVLKFFRIKLIQAIRFEAKTYRILVKEVIFGPWLIIVQWEFQNHLFVYFFFILGPIFRGKFKCPPVLPYGPIVHTCLHMHV